VFVTHDQGEALSMSDRVAVFDAGRIVQVDTPESIYEKPRTRFVASFVGGSNVLEPAVAARLGAPARLASLRPEAIAVRAAGAADSPGRTGLDGTCVEVQYQGASRRVVADCGGVRLTALVPAQEAREVRPGAALRLSFAPQALHPMAEEP
jgi:putative spermidine/putrescine transport system ATP-binding protein